MTLLRRKYLGHEGANELAHHPPLVIHTSLPELGIAPERAETYDDDDDDEHDDDINNDDNVGNDTTRRRPITVGHFLDTNPPPPIVATNVGSVRGRKRPKIKPKDDETSAVAAVAVGTEPLQVRVSATLSAFASASSVILDPYAALRIPPSLLQRNAAWCFDICTATSRSTACFTSSYGRFVRGTGSILYTPGGPAAAHHPRSSSDQQQVTLSSSISSITRRQRPEDRQFDPDWARGCMNLSTELRYFSGMEMSRLMGFPHSFTFPPSIRLKQQWKLVGNSLNVPVAARLIELALRCRSGEWSSSSK